MQKHVTNVPAVAVGGCQNVGESRHAAARTMDFWDTKILPLAVSTGTVSVFGNPQDHRESGGVVLSPSCWKTAASATAHDAFDCKLQSCFALALQTCISVPCIRPLSIAEVLMSLQVLEMYLNTVFSL